MYISASWNANKKVVNYKVEKIMSITFACHCSYKDFYMKLIESDYSQRYSLSLNWTLYLVLPFLYFAIIPPTFCNPYIPITRQFLIQSPILRLMNYQIKEKCHRRQYHKNTWNGKSSQERLINLLEFNQYAIKPPY